jgi:hypothetical protein
MRVEVTWTVPAAPRRRRCSIVATDAARRFDTLRMHVFEYADWRLFSISVSL